MITVYSSNGCAACLQAKDYLTRNAIPFTIKNISEDADAKSFLIDSGFRTVPQFFKGDEHIASGYVELTSLDRSVLM